jgi:hypothetical protein
MFSVGSVPRLYTEETGRPFGGDFEYLNRSTVEQKEATKRELNGQGYNWVTLFLGDINTGT